MKCVSASRMRELDRRMTAERGVSAEVLMDRAGLGVAHAVRRLRRLSGCDEAPVLLVAGRGNNGGDAFAAARHLALMGIPARVLIAGTASAVSETAAAHLRILLDAGGKIEERPEPGDWRVEDCLPCRPRGVVVDALLGTGFSGVPRGVILNAIDWINSRAAFNRIVSVDLPSGMDADSGEGDHVVRADVTITLGAPKKGILLPAGLEAAGQVRVVDIGIPAEWVSDEECDVELISSDEMRALLPRRARAAHKGDFGTVLVVAGARGYAGAAALAARAALVSGAGLVHVVTPTGCAGTVAAMVPEAMVHPAAQTDTGSLAETAWHDIAHHAERASAVLVGPGLTTHESGTVLLRRILALPLPVVLDADALSMLAGMPGVLRARTAGTILTPHPGEMARLLKTTSSGVQSDRFAAARKSADEWNSVIVLKGAGTIVHQKGRPICVNATGNPGMATAGAGDVLAGVITAQVAAGIPAFEASLLSVYLHGMAGDISAMRLTESSVCASDIIQTLHQAFRELTFR